MSDSSVEGITTPSSLKDPDADDDDFCAGDFYAGSEDLICKVALPFSDPKFQLYHEIISLGEQIKTLKAEKPMHFKKRVCTECVFETTALLTTTNIR